MSTQIPQFTRTPDPLQEQDVFDVDVAVFIAEAVAFVEGANALGQEMQINADVAAALILAMALPQFMGTSTTSLAIGTGTKTVATQTGKAWIAGQWVIASNGTNYMKGQVAAYDSGTGALDVSVSSVNGTGTFNSWTIGLSYEGLLLAGAGDNTNIARLLGLLEVPAVVAAAQRAAYQPSVPQTVLAGPADTNGNAAFGGTTGSATLTAAATLLATCFAGDGLHRYGSIVNPAFTAPAGSGTAFLYLEITAAGVVSAGVSAMPWVVQRGGTPSVTNGQHTVNYAEGKVYVGNGTVATQVYRVCIGECAYSSGSWSGSLVWYAIKGRSVVYTSNITAPQSTNLNHNIGSRPESVEARLECLTAEAGWSVGDEIPVFINAFDGSGYREISVGLTSRNSLTVAAANASLSLVNKAGNTTPALTPSYWRIKLICDRDWR